MTTTNTKETVFTYYVSFVGNDTSVHIEFAEDTNDIPHEVMAVRAEETLCEMWNVDSVPPIYSIINISVQEEEL
jgi:hypothetical protein